MSDSVKGRGTRRRSGASRVRRAIARSHRAVRMLLAAAVVLGAMGAVAAAPAPPEAMPGLVELPPGHVSEMVSLKQAAVALPVAGLLAAALAFRPQRRGTPPRQAAVIQTQIILGMVGALVMLVVGASLARAFGIVGAASLVRYRAKVDDPKDAGIMLSCLGIGLASGVGIYWVATLATLVILCVVWMLESLEPKTRKELLLKVAAKDSPEIRSGIEGVLRANKVTHELRGVAGDDLTYVVKLPLSRKTDPITSALLELGEPDQIAVEWADRKSKDKA